MTKEEDFHPAVQLVLQRIRSNPEEFLKERQYPKDVLTVVGTSYAHFTEEEKNAYDEAIRLARMDKFHTDLMAAILRDPEEGEKEQERLQEEARQLKQQMYAQAKLQAQSNQQNAYAPPYSNVPRSVYDDAIKLANQGNSNPSTQQGLLRSLGDYFK